ncbi:alpha beta-hydrolase [Halenospora varia]|nr:alpha beta-hydrolase [Halenospora varia]
MPLPTPTLFKVEVSNSFLSYINDRVATGRISGGGVKLPPGKEWARGIPPETMTHLQEYWKTKYDWRAVEARINSHLKMFTIPIKHDEEELTIHFVHHRSNREGAIPLLFQHGWPGNFLEVEKIIDSLTNPKDPSQQAYHVVAPSLPGFVFSDPSTNPNFNLLSIAAINNKLMLYLGYPKYIAQGGDWGSMVTRTMAVQFPDSCVGVHVNMTVAPPPSWWRATIIFFWFILWAIWTGKDKEGKLGRMQWWMTEESGYSEIQSTKPQALSYALTDSPIGMLAWLRDKMELLIDDDYTWTEEESITWAMLYLIAGNSGHACIYTNFKGEKLKMFNDYLLNKRISKNVDFGASIFPKEVFNVPRWWAKTSIAQNIVFWREHDKGGHFASVERPDVLVKDIRDWTAVMNPARIQELKRVGKAGL